MTIKTIATNNGYSVELLRKFILWKSRESVQKFFDPENNENPTTIKFVKLNCVQRVTYIICNKLGKFCGTNMYKQERLQ